MISALHIKSPASTSASKKFPEEILWSHSGRLGNIGRDIEDAIILGLIRREDLPDSCKAILGNTNGTIVYNLVTDLITHSHIEDFHSSSIGFSAEVAATRGELKAINYERIYLAPTTKQQNPLVRDCYRSILTITWTA